MKYLSLILTLILFSCAEKHADFITMSSPLITLEENKSQLEKAKLSLNKIEDQEAHAQIFELVHFGESIRFLVDSIREELEQQELEGPNSLADMTIPNKVMIENGQGIRLKEVLIDFQERAFEVDSLNFEMIRLSEGDEAPWEEINFKDVPFAAVVSYLKHLEGMVSVRCGEDINIYLEKNLDLAEIH